MTAGNTGEFPESRSKKRKTIVKRGKPDKLTSDLRESGGASQDQTAEPRLNPCQTGNEILTCSSKSKNAPTGSSKRAGSSTDTILEHWLEAERQVCGSEDLRAP